MEVLAGVRDCEYHGNLRVELGIAVLLEVMRSVEFQPVLPEGHPTFGQLSDAAVCAGYASADHSPATVCTAMAQGDRHARCGATSRGIEHVCRNAHELSML